MFTLDSVFGYLFQQIFGWKHTEFVFYKPDGTINTNIPLSEANPLYIITILYVLSVIGIPRFMKDRKPFNLKPLFAVHNIVLCIASLFLLLLFLEILIPIWYTEGFYFSICSSHMWDGDRGRRLELLYYLNYIYKFYELIDTYFMMFSKKNVEFLHSYHHCATYWLCYTQLVGNTSVQWFVITLNLFVHVIMYYYYARTALGANIWWKKYLTTLQIVQFFMDLGIIYFCTTAHYMGLWYPETFNLDCHGTEFAAFVGIAILTSYFGLFIQFFINTYNRRSATTTKKTE